MHTPTLQPLTDYDSTHLIFSRSHALRGNAYSLIIICTPELFISPFLGELLLFRQK